MTQDTICPECGAEWRDGLTCDDHFYQMLAWDFENAEDAWSVHHLTVLCFHIQHPSRYSPEGLQGALELLDDAVNKGLTAADLREKVAPLADSATRTTHILSHGTAASHGRTINWPIIAADITRGGAVGYTDRVRAWAQSIQTALETTT